MPELDIEGIMYFEFDKLFFLEIIILIIVILIFLKFYVFGKGNQRQLEQKNKINKIKIQIKNMDLNKKKSDFYNELNDLFREYFYILGIKNSKTLSLKEIKSFNLNSSIIILFENSYLKEFTIKIDTKKERQGLINNIYNIIK